MSASMLLARLKARVAKEVKGPSWKRSTITYEELGEYLHTPPQPLITSHPPPLDQYQAKREFKIRYYMHDYDIAGNFIYIIPDNCLWVEVFWETPAGVAEGENVKVNWNDIDWNGFGIFHNDGFEFKQVERT